MTESLLAAESGPARWTCPFCVLLCDDLSVRASASGTSLELADGECASARSGLARFPATPSAATPLVDGHPADLAGAIAAAARILAVSRQPLFGGLGTDVAGARAVYRLACETGAICDPAGGAVLMQSVRSLQDRGGFTTTLAEVRTRADLIVCLNELPTGEAAEFFARCGLAEEGLVPQRHVVLLGGKADDPAGLAALARNSGVTTEVVPLHGDLFSTVALLSALLARRSVRAVPLPLSALADRLRAARYAVIVGQTDRLPAQGGLIVEAIHRIVGTLNATTRAGAMWLGGGNGAGTVNEVFTWLSGLPLRTRAGPAGLEHEPLCFDTSRLLADAAVDCLLWISSFDPMCAPPVSPVPLVLLGHPGLASSAAHVGSVFIPVSTPGIGSAGHLFRADGGTVLPLVPVYRDTLPALADVLGRITQGVSALRARASP
ncbi:formylmethanofuran dehydrogenase [Variovorax sp. J2P1-59]|uniref:formylmethanofuran dehydrogenase n=1 Tax=Variovorax flavidus TaxID=3053501 RepID=UPI00257875B4|nr:formylmethanofuran dehydrogenase [Variovorax sp. J2P1-59]MDM0073263.1 formylmethanofuran dehydrogenase [Variovorax sp. J2P1-59]